MDQSAPYSVSLTTQELTLLIRLLAVEAFDATMAQVADDAEAALDLLIRLQWAQTALARQRATRTVTGQVRSHEMAPRP